MYYYRLHEAPRCFFYFQIPILTPIIFQPSPVQSEPHFAQAKRRSVYMRYRFLFLLLFVFSESNLLRKNRDWQSSSGQPMPSAQILPEAVSYPSRFWMRNIPATAGAKHIRNQKLFFSYYFSFLNLLYMWTSHDLSHALQVMCHAPSTFLIGKAPCLWIRFKLS